MAKEIVRVAKLEFNAGQAKPGPELAGLGINMPSFTKEFNDKTKERNGEPVPVVITVYKDKSFTFELKTAPTAFKLLQAAKVKKGSANSKTTFVGRITLAQLEEIAKYKMPDLNTNKLESAMEQVAGTARNMGILIEGRDNIEEKQKAAEAAIKAAKAVEAKAAEIAASEAKAIEEAKANRPIEVKTIADEKAEEKAAQEKESN